MTDIVETLRDGCDCGSAKAECPAKEACQDAFDAADEIERLREALHLITQTAPFGRPQSIAREALGEEWKPSMVLEEKNDGIR